MNSEDIKSTITAYYLNGAFNKTNIILFKKIFHPEFAIVNIQDDGSFYLFTRDMWEEVLKKRLQEPKFDFASVALKSSYRNIDVEGSNASVSLDLMRGDKVVYTDFLLLKCIEGKWIIVSKIYHEHKSDQN